ncbi:hypothetical protein ACQV2E_15750 [Pantoea allii]|uniref:hypothetical protein n=1 Tax=Pantoea TaxID=53335 RepID=UPI003D310781
MKLFLRAFVFLILVSMLNVYVLLLHPDIKGALVAVDLLSFAMAIAIIYGDIMASDENE